MKTDNTKKRLCTLLALSLALLISPALFAADGLPSADNVIAKYIDAVGGEKTIRATTSMRVKGKMEMPAMGMSGDLELVSKAPDLMAMTMDMPGVGQIKTGYNGDIAWSDNPMTGAMILDGDMAKQLIKQADFHGDLNYVKRYPTRETLEKIEFAGQETYKVKLVDPDGKESFEYFAVDSGLMVGQEGEQASEMGTMFVTTELSNWQEFDGRKVPMLSSAKMMGMEMNMIFEEVSFNSVDDEAFELPDTIQTLTKADG